MSLYQLYLISLLCTVAFSVVKIGYSNQNYATQRFFHDIQYGFYVDIGAFDPIFYSQTAHLHAKGWTGVNIDANYQKIKTFFLQRGGNMNINQAVDKDRKYAQLAKLDLQSQQGINPNYTQYLKKTYPKNAPKETGQVQNVSTISLQELCHRFYKQRPIFMSLNVAGNEGSALQSNNWNNTQCRPQVLLVKIEGLIQESKQKRNGQITVQEIMNKNGYKKHSNDGFYQIWIDTDKFQVYQKKYEAYTQIQKTHKYVSILKLNHQLMSKTIVGYKAPNISETHFDPKASKSFIYIAKKSRNLILSQIYKSNKQAIEKNLSQQSPILVSQFDAFSNYIVNDKQLKIQDFYLDIDGQQQNKYTIHFWKFKLKIQQKNHTVFILDHELLPVGKQLKVLSVEVKSVEDLEAESAKLIGNLTIKQAEQTAAEKEQQQNRKQISQTLQKVKGQTSYIEDIKIIIIFYAFALSLISLLAGYCLIQVVKKIPRQSIQNVSKIDGQ